MKKLISILLAMLVLGTSFTVAFAAESALKSYSISETYNDGYITLDYNFNDETAEDEFGIQSAANLPAKYSSVDKGYVTPVKMQTSPSCWAYATAAALESDVIANFAGPTANTTAFSTAHLTWFTYTAPKSSSDKFYGEYYNIGSSSPYNLGGNWNRAAATLANFRGIAEKNTAPSDVSLNESLRYTSDSGYVLKDAVVLDSTDEIKNWIVNHGSCYLSYYQDDNYLNASNGAYYYTSKTASNHAITIVGWDDNYSKSNFNRNPGVNGAWLCKNSFGTSYTNLGGYMWISYADASIDLSNSFFGFSAQKNVYSHNYSYNNIAFISYITLQDSVTAANVFTAADDEKVSAVMVQTINKNLNATVKVYTDIPAGSKTPDAGTLATTCSTSFTNVGYHTVTLNEKVDIKKGSKFAVVVTYSGNGSIGLPIEKSTSTLIYTGNEGESYMYFNDAWHDCRTYGGGVYRNVYINALAEKIVLNNDLAVNPNTSSTTHTHNYVVEEKAATCSANGYKKVYCSDCGDVKSNTTYQKLPHSYSVTVKEATCTENGCVTHTCACGDKYETNYTPATGHNFQRSRVVSESSKKTVYELKCAKCNATQTETVERNFIEMIIWFFTNLFKTK